MTEAERIEDDKAENLLVEMSVTLNNLCRFYDQKDDNGMKYVMEKAYELSHKGIGHLMELDKLTAENERLQQLIKEKDDTIKSHKAIIDKLAHEESEASKYIRDELKSAQELNRELVGFLTMIPIDPIYYVEYQELITRAK